jgi:hypothetical protein
MNLLLFIILCYGISNTIVYGSMFNAFRGFLSKFGTGDWSFHKLFSCMMCLPVWVGFVVSYILITQGLSIFTPFGIAADSHIKIAVFFSGLISGGAVWFIHTIQEYFEK